MTQDLKHFKATFNGYDIFLYLKTDVPFEKIKLYLFTVSEFIAGIVFYEYSNTISIRIYNDLSINIKSIVFELIVLVLDTCLTCNNAELLYLATHSSRNN